MNDPFNCVLKIKEFNLCDTKYENHSSNLEQDKSINEKRKINKRTLSSSNSLNRIFEACLDELNPGIQIHAEFPSKTDKINVPDEKKNPKINVI
ncbi:hypothetical protein BpHYR1_030908 [Brachionus plicatilis]|uniref:Uncharacterized protein n=1 Tax=Brachionus plicatilis TaxID=10195 RepID=A0A3M7QSX1_BRAPC|nr:hypothetical protein BpHYR1_030908 [Brachionus plicatilis]